MLGRSTPDDVGPSAPDGVNRVPEAASQPPVERGDSQFRRLLMVVFVIGVLHAGLYAVSFPPMGDRGRGTARRLCLELAFDQRIPDIEDPLDQSIIDAVAKLA